MNLCEILRLFIWNKRRDDYDWDVDTRDELCHRFLEGDKEHVSVCLQTSYSLSLLLIVTIHLSKCMCVCWKLKLVCLCISASRRLCSVSFIRASWTLRKENIWSLHPILPSFLLVSSSLCFSSSSFYHSCGFRLWGDVRCLRETLEKCSKKRFRREKIKIGNRV